MGGREEKIRVEVLPAREEAGIAVHLKGREVLFEEVFGYRWYW
jgi:hypothetical protein